MSDGKDDVCDAYEAWADTYDVDRNRTRDLDADVVRQAGLALTGCDVLELGCGTGKNTIWLAAHALSVVALDFSPSMLERARVRVDAKNTQFLQHDVRLPWPLPDAAVHVVIGNLVLEHVAELAPVFGEAARVLKLGGQLFFCELHPERQRAGRQAEFSDGCGNVRRVSAYLHSVADYVNGGISSGFTLRHLGEWSDVDAAPGATPRLLSVLFCKDDD